MNVYLSYFLIILASFGYIFFIKLPQNKEMLFIWVAIISMLFGLILAVIYRFSKGRGNPLIFTERGIVIDPLLVETWEDIETFRWEKFQGLTRISFSSKGEGMCLQIVNKGVIQRNIETWTGHTMMAQYGIFFTKEQMKETEIIFQKYGISRIDI